ncbi:AbrB family transcriptional regulator [Bacillus sp. FJAT-25509]|uniref:AbrB family transcriptional regulator n=1 Tax=Bacillus sp. FJAT-25509 TaxID=1712029 RepID=UPI0006F93F7D|nr:AbrB family transcriptional regulator [Bacillus sp. FJAT-25509]
MKDRRWIGILIIWFGIIAGTLLIGTLLEDQGFPSPHLFAALLVGIIVAFTSFNHYSKIIPSGIFTVAQAITGVLLGTYFNPSSIASLGNDWPIVLLVTGATLVLSVLTGFVFARVTKTDLATSTLGMIAGGSAGVIATSDDLNADGRLVAFMQFVRLFLVVFITPLLVRLVLLPTGNYEYARPAEIEATGPIFAGCIFTLCIAIVGAWLGNRFHIPAGALIVPLILGAVLSTLKPFQGLTPPELIREPAFTLIGLQIGLRFDREALRLAQRLLPAITGFVLILIIGCGAFGLVLAKFVHINLLSGYLATTPGGINAVMAIAFGTGADTTLIFEMQSFRLFIMLLVAVPLVRWLINLQKA